MAGSDADHLLAFLKQIFGLHVHAIAQDDAGLVLIHLWLLSTGHQSQKSIVPGTVVHRPSILPHRNKVHMLPGLTNDSIRSYQLKLASAMHDLKTLLTNGYWWLLLDFYDSIALSHARDLKLLPLCASML
ncbi:hypothetical protein EJB05_46977, partial [Eragrostis curvula]